MQRPKVTSTGSAFMFWESEGDILQIMRNCALSQKKLCPLSSGTKTLAY